MQFAESKHTPLGGTPGAYLDAVGDLDRMDAKWGPSVSGFQIRCLRDPNAWGPLDRWRVAELLHDDPDYAARAAFAISKSGTDWTPWSVFRSGAYLPYKGTDYTLRRGHPRAGEWSR